MIHLTKQVASFLLARLNPELSRAICCVSIQYTCRSLSACFSLLCEVSVSRATPTKIDINFNCPASLTKRFASTVLPMRVPSFCAQNTPAAVSPKFVPAGSSTLVYSPLPSVGYSSFEVFWSHRDQVSSGSPLVFLQYPRLSSRGEQYLSSILFPWGHLLLVFHCPGVDSRSILC